MRRCPEIVRFCPEIMRQPLTKSDRSKNVDRRPKHCPPPFKVAQIVIIASEIIPDHWLLHKAFLTRHFTVWNSTRHGRHRGRNRVWRSMLTKTFHDLHDLQNTLVEFDNIWCPNTLWAGANMSIRLMTLTSSFRTTIGTLWAQPFTVSDANEDPIWRLPVMMIWFLMNRGRVCESRWTCSFANPLPT